MLNMELELEKLKNSTRTCLSDSVLFCSKSHVLYAFESLVGITMPECIGIPKMCWMIDFSRIYREVRVRIVGLESGNCTKPQKY